MITLFQNEETGNYFFVDSKNNTLKFISYKASKTFFEYKDFLSLKVVKLPDYASIKKFQKLVKSGILANVPLEDVASFLIKQYPELFI